MSEELSKIQKFVPMIAVLFAIIGLIDSVYLTVNHYTEQTVPCSLTGGCEAVLTSSYASFGGIPTAAFGAVAYFLAFSLALLTVFGNRAMWKLFGALTLIMSCASLGFVYIQAFVLNAFCQFCLLSAFTSISLFALFLITLFAGNKK